MSMDWAIPSADITTAIRQKIKAENAKADISILKECPKCKSVYHDSDTQHKKYTGESQIRYDAGVLPTINLKRENCYKCQF